MSSRLLLISHAATPAVRAAAFPRDESIDEGGRRDAKALAASLPTFAAVWSAPSKRTLETAAAFGLEAALEGSLRDIDLGRWAGRTFEDVGKSEPESLARWMSDPAAAPHGGESVIEFIERVSQWLSGVRQLRGCVAAISHPAVIRAAIVSAIEASPNSFWRMDVAPLSVVDLRTNGARWTLRSIRCWTDVSE